MATGLREQGSAATASGRRNAGFGSWPCDNALEGVSADRDRRDALRRDRFEQIFPIWVLEATLVRRRPS